MGREDQEMGPGEPGSKDVNHKIKGLTDQPVIAKWATGSMEDHVSKNNMKRNIEHMTLIPDLNCMHGNVHPTGTHVYIHINHLRTQVWKCCGIMLLYNVKICHLECFNKKLIGQ